MNRTRLTVFHTLLTAILVLTGVLPALPAQAYASRAMLPTEAVSDVLHAGYTIARARGEYAEGSPEASSDAQSSATAAQAGRAALDGAIDPGPWDQAHPSAATHSTGTTYAVWEDYRGASPHIRFAERPDRANWQPSLQLDPTANGDQTSPRIAADSSGNLYAKWEDYRGAQSQIYFAYRPTGGDWGVSEPVAPPVEHVRDTPVGERREPLDVKVAVDGEGNVHAVWDDRQSGDTHHQIHAAYRTVGGSWSVNARIDDGAGSVVERVDYDPFGTPSFSGGGLGQQTSPNMSDESLLGTPYLFRDRWHDAESGLYAHGGRRYDPMIGRYLQRGADALGKPYTFTHNNLLEEDG